MLNILLIALGGGIGSILRYLLATSTYAIIGKNFPYGTLLVNVLGCFLVGIVSVLLLERFDGMAGELRALLIIGFMGGFTTFSTFSLETLNLYESGQLGYAALNVILSVMFCLFGTWLGIVLGRQL